MSKKMTTAAGGQISRATVMPVSASAATLPTWSSPAATANTLHHLRTEGVTEIGYAELRPKDDRPRSVLSLAYAKLNPVMPEATSPRTRCGWPTTARDHRLVLAPGVADPVSLDRLFGDYDRATPDNQRLLATVLTIQFSRDQPLHQQFEEVTVFASLKLARERQLTSLAVLHVPGDQAADGRPHAHLLVLSRTHHASGWGAVHTESDKSEHAAWAGEWAAWTQAWRRPVAA